MHTALNEADCRAIMDVVSDYLIITDPEGRIRNLNRGPLGFGPSRYVNQNFLCFVAESQRPIVQDALNRLRGEAPTMELEVQWQETERWYRLRIGAIKDKSELKGFAIHLLNIDEQKRSEAERARLRTRVRSLPQGVITEPTGADSQRLLELMADSLPFLISYVDKQRRYQYNNAAYERWFDTSREELAGRALDEVLGSPAYERIRSYVNTALNGQPVTFEMMIPYKNAGLRRVVAHYVPDLLPTGDVQGFFALVEDVSIRREAEQALRQKDDELRQLQKMEALGRLAGGIAHEFNNLLQVIIGSCTTILMTADDDSPLARQAARVNRAAHRGTSLTRQLLSFSRQAEPTISAIDLDALVGDTALLLEPLLGSSMQLETDLSSRREIDADTGQLQQILMNLAINARDAMPDGGQLYLQTAKVTLSPEEASAHVSLAPGDYALLQVRDTGTGMDEATRSRIFDPFFTTKSADEGTGLGLSTVYGIVHQLGGHIDVESQLGEGTVFRIYFPCRELAE